MTGCIVLVWRDHFKPLTLAEMYENVSSILQGDGELTII